MNYRAARKRTYNLFAPEKGGELGRWVDIGIMGLIVLNVIAVILSTVDWIDALAGELFWYFELVSVSVFTIEYVARVWSAVEAGTYEGILFGRIQFASKPLLIIDLLAILPFYLAVAGLQIDLRFLRALRLVRLFRVLKLARYSSAIASFAAVFRDKKEKLVLALFANGLLLVLAASAIYFVENPHQPDVFSSIPASFYWAIVTLSTVGYGDVTPVTELGRILAGIFAMIGIGLFALPASILASGFIEQAEDEELEEWEYCPHCRERLD